MVELSKTFELECETLDRDHQRLVEMVNDIVALLDDPACINCEEKVYEFINFAKGHFSREEQLLAKSGYPNVGKHKEHHRQLDKKMEHLVEFAGMVGVNEIARESLKKELVFFVMDDIITNDLDFKEFVSDQHP
ncbi:MAG TPA: hypothetical protein ENI69_04305 [Rhodospirillales bacterium]|nr:hypothetical protein [Rhodospirillales bacterium]